jgi:hypothetical protein
MLKAKREKTRDLASETFGTIGSSDVSHCAISCNNDCPSDSGASALPFASRDGGAA